MLRSNLPPTSVYVIPNAIVADHFHPPSSRPPTDTSPYSRLCPLTSTYPHTSVACTVTIVVISRLAYRKGVDLLVAIAPRICAAFPNVRFVVGVYFVLSCDFSHYGIISSLLASGGDGPKMVDLLQMRETHFLQDQITLLGPVAHRDVPSVRVYRIDLIFEVQTSHSAGSSTGFYLFEYFPYGGFRYCDTRSRVCRPVCCIHSRRWGARDPSRRYDLVRRSHSRWCLSDLI